jgi:hypothetical protein
LIVSRGVCLLCLWFEVCPKIVQHLIGYFALTWHNGFDISFEERVSTGLVMIIKRGKEFIVKLLGKFWLITLCTETINYLLHLLLRELGCLSNILNLVPGFLFALCIWHC